MDHRIRETIVTVVGRGDPGDPDAALSVLSHVDDYEPSDAYSNRLSNVEGLDRVETGQYLFADHVPSGSDVRSEPPNVFSVDDDDGIAVQFRADDDALDDFLDALDHVLGATDLDVAYLGVMVRLSVDVTGGGPVEDLGSPEGFDLEAKIDTERERSMLRLQAHTDGMALTEDSDPVDDRVDEAVGFVTDRLP
ncbi:hypothetical protein BRD00_11750 [Halobacteriales archaeon QS_8_69_26]|nr:MAG: hypothetical protein BRD00_11750 [Halobacteriales archaeon QS_8_69_26]